MLYKPNFNVKPIAMIRDPKRLSAGFTSLEGGADSGANPSTLRDNQVAYAINVTFRNGYAQTRPRVMQTILTFEDADTRTWFESHHVQGAEYYEASSGNNLILASVGGRIFKIDPFITGVNIWDITVDANPELRPHAWFKQAEQYMVIQDGQSIPLIFDGSILRRSMPGPPNYEVPIGTVMEYGLGRLVVARPTGRSYVIGDLVNSGKEVIQFTETTFLAEGGDIFIPIPGRITAMRIIAVLDNSTGQGDLIVHTSEGAVSARIGELRTTWKDIPFQRIAQLKNGAKSQASTTLVNGDMFYRSKDGLRSLAMSQRNFVTSWVNTPISREANSILTSDTQRFLSYSSAVLFDNRVLLTVTPTYNFGRVYHRGLLVLDFDLISSLTQKLPPAYDLLWTGLQPTALVVGEFQDEEQCFALHYNNGVNELWRITKEVGDDNDETPVSCVVETRSMNHQTPMMLKKLDSGDIFVDNIRGTVAFDVKYRPDQYPCWFDWHSWSICQTTNDCSLTNGCLPLLDKKPGYRARMILPQPSDECDMVGDKPSRIGYEFQSRIAWTGVARIKGWRQHAYDQQESPNGCVTDEECRVKECCVPDPLTYTVPSVVNRVSE